MEKKQLEKRIFHTGRRCSNFKDNRYRWGDILELLKEKKIELQDTDILEIGFTEGYQEEDSARDDFYDVTIYRSREETDAELTKRMKQVESMKESSRKRRYETYLELKEEFKDK